MIPRLLTIAGSDSSGGAGIQADLKTFEAFETYGMTAVTALTVQNTQGVYEVMLVDPALVRAQIRAVRDDVGVDAVKIGMLGSAAIIEAVADELIQGPPVPIVVDPVFRAKGGTPLIDTEAVRVLAERLVPLATVITPNLPEAGHLAGFAVRDRGEMLKAAQAIAALGAQAVLVKGGHLAGDEAADLLWHHGEARWFAAPRIVTAHTHGTGCTLSSAIAANLARGQSMVEAIETAKRFVTLAIEHAPGLGRGHGPLGHAAARRGMFSG
ncbi:MAG: bifunctional hydroxymethylpyrimidine kinase/phosphomethylpyrimidine kinase [Firmicutes bacterium]|nr:bifunctional hydroxymethylpyrimidine kinase/phosphomethylpyrimidine kinase [Bacillota bacterium]